VWLSSASPPKAPVDSLAAEDHDLGTTVLLDESRASHFCVVKSISRVIIAQWNSRRPCCTWEIKRPFSDVNRDLGANITPPIHENSKRQVKPSHGRFSALIGRDVVGNVGNELSIGAT
jgi:hypothetical protein